MTLEEFREILEESEYFGCAHIEQIDNSFLVIQGDFDLGKLEEKLGKYKK